jgi:hypothetical protein
MLGDITSCIPRWSAYGQSNGGESDERVWGYVRIAGKTYKGFWLDSLKRSD